MHTSRAHHTPLTLSHLLITNPMRHAIMMMACLMFATSCSSGAENHAPIDCDAEGIDVCQEPACAPYIKCATDQELEHCYNGVDDDGDGLIDCEDDQCKPLFLCLENIEDCANGRDDDRDGLIDCQDSACANTSICKPGAEACAGGLDEDSDGEIDCEDADCGAVFACLISIELPDNQIDDDEDGLIDCNDPDIARTSACLPDGERCDDNADNDQDGKTDCADADCANTITCLLGKETCNNGLDDNGDGDIDCEDATCQGHAFCQAGNLVEICIPGSGDEDRDGVADCQDDACRYVWHCLTDGMPDLCTRLDDNGTPDCSDPDCGAEPVCQISPEICDDGIDNDQDGLTDCDDVEECFIPFIDLPDNSCMRQFCGDPDSGDVSSVNASDFDEFDGSSLPIFTAEDMTRHFPEVGGSTVLRGNLRFTNSFDTPMAYTLPPNSLRCILPEPGQPLDSSGILTVEPTGPPLTSSGFEQLTISSNIEVSLPDELSDFGGLSNLRHVLGALDFDETAAELRLTSPFTFTGLESLITIGRSISYNVTADDAQVTRPFSFDALTSLVEVRGDLLALREDGADISSTGPCYWAQFDTNADVNGRFEGLYTTVQSFAGLGSLRRVGGDVCVAAPASEGVDFTGLENLEVIEGDFIVAHQDARPTMPALDIIPISYEPLTSLRHVGKNFGTFYEVTPLDENEEMFATIAMTVSSYTGLENLESIGGHFVVVMGDGFDDFAALSNLERVDGHLFVQRPINSAPPSPIFSGLTSLQSIGRTLHVEETNISTFAGLENLASIGGLELYNNASLTSLDVLADTITTFPQGSLAIDSLHPSLANLDGLENLTQVGRSFYISDRELNELVGKFDNLESVGGRLWLETIQETNIDQRVSYRGLFPSLASIGGIRLANVDITNLSGLTFGSSMVTHGIVLQDLPSITENTEFTGVVTVQGDVAIIGVPKNPLEMLADVETISGSLMLDSNAELTSMQNLQRLTSIGGSFTLSNNASLDSLLGLGALTQIPGDLVIQDNASLNNIDALDQITNVNGDVLVSGTNLINLVGLQRLAAVGGDFTLSNNRSLIQLTDLSSSLVIGMDVTIQNNNALNIIEGIMQPIIFGELIIKANDNLLNLSFPTLTEVQRGLKVQENDRLIDLSGFDALTRVGEFLFIESNLLLAEFEGGMGDGAGLENLNTLDGDLYIQNNPALTTIAVLTNLVTFTGSIVKLDGNTTLSDECTVVAHLRLLGYLGNPTLTPPETCP